MNQSSVDTPITPFNLSQAVAVELNLLYRRPYTPAQRKRELQHLMDAITHLLDDKVEWRRQGMTFWFESQSARDARAKGETVHPDLCWHQVPPNGREESACECRGRSKWGRCWHPAGRSLLIRILDVDAALPFDARKTPLVKPKPTTPRAQVLREAAEMEVR